MIADEAVPISHRLGGGARTASGWTTSVLGTRELQGLSPAAWDELSRRSLVANPFYERPYLLAGIGTVDRWPIRAVVVRCPSGRLVGLFPFETVLPGPLSLRRGARNLYQFNGTPLIDVEAAPFVVRSFLAWLAGVGCGRLWIMPDIDFGSPLTRLIEQEAAGRSFVTSRARPYRRSVLTPMDKGLDAHLTSVLSKSRLKDLKRNLRRLEERGNVAFERAEAPALLDERLEHFLALEASGWKGKAGTAFLSREKHAAFARRAFGGMVRETGRLVIDSLLLDGRPLAISLNIVGGADIAFTPKCAFDEDWRTYSPGLLLEYFVIKAFHEHQRFAAMDSATTKEGHVIADMWNGSIEMGDLIIRSHSLAGNMLEGMVRTHERARRLAKRVRDEWRGRRRNG